MAVGYNVGWGPTRCACACAVTKAPPHGRSAAVKIPHCAKMDNVPTSTRKRLAPEPTTAAHKQARVQDPLLSPTMMYGNSITWASSAKDWNNDVSSVMIEGENCYSFRIEVLNKLPLIAAPFSKNPSIIGVPIPTTYKSSINMAQAKVLTSFASALSASDGECCTVTQVVQEASLSVSDSDDEQILTQQFHQHFPILSLPWWFRPAIRSFTLPSDQL